MRNQILAHLAIAFLLAAPRYAAAQTAIAIPSVEQAVASITPELAQSCVEALASDAMLGRNTPSPELDSAARYIIGRFKAAGVEGVSGSYLHEYYLKQQDLGEKNSLVINNNSFDLRSGFLPFEFSGSGSIVGDLVFVGFGIARDDSSYDDYAGIDVRGKIVVAIAGEPRMGADSFAMTSGIEVNAREKMRIAAQRGAIGFMLLANPLQSKFLRPAGYPWRALFRKSGSKTQTSLNYQLDIDSPVAPILAIGISGDAAKEIFGRSIEEISALVRRIDSTGRPASMPLASKAKMEVEIAKTRTPVHNVIGVVRGRLLPDEYIVIGAHYDHVGHYRSNTPGDENRNDTIYNGADDNASGTTALILAAEAFASLPVEERPARSILFIAFSGEEKGLYGSRAFVANPSVPLGSIVAMLNMDMVGRNHRDSISVGGFTRSKDLAALAEVANQAEPMILAYDLEHMFSRSDHASFAAKRIPSLFFSSGLHPDYHQVTDSPEKVDNVKVARVARLCFRTAFEAANVETRPRYEPLKESGESYFFD